MTTRTWADEARAAAARIEHPWDRKALRWPLTRDSVVVEVGGYKGRWALQIAQRYRPQLYVFEPQPWAAETCAAVLGDLATVLPYALGVADGTMDLDCFGTDGATLTTGRGEPVPVLEVGAVFAELGLTRIDLLLMNIEGYEYTLLPYMLTLGIRPRFLMLQQHTHARGETDLDAVLTAHGYRQRWSYGDVLSAWEVA